MEKIMVIIFLEFTLSRFFGAEIEASLSGQVGGHSGLN